MLKLMPSSFTCRVRPFGEGVLPELGVCPKVGGAEGGLFEFWLRPPSKGLACLLIVSSIVHLLENFHNAINKCLFSICEFFNIGLHVLIFGGDLRR
jgi:hypothetical protein